MTDNIQNLFLLIPHSKDSTMIGLSSANIYNSASSLPVISCLVDTKVINKKMIYNDF